MQTTSNISSLPTVTFYCLQNRSMRASFSTSTVVLELSDGRSVTLPQQRMGSGIRYEATTTTASSTEDFAFISKGDTAFLSEDGLQTYKQCIAAHLGNGAPGYRTYSNQGKTFVFTFPDAFSVTGRDIGIGYSTNWAALATTSGMKLAEVLVSKNYLPGTNFNDATFSVGASANPSSIATCTHNPSGSRGSSAVTVINGVSFTKLSFQDAAAGNRYDTTSYRTIRDNMCYAIEYTIHYGVFQNYPAGSIRQFKESKLRDVLDQVVQSFHFLGS